jgi:hypothetical protein
MVLKGLIAPSAHSLSAVGEPSAALQRVANRPIVCHVLDAMCQAGITDIALLVSTWESAEVRACVSAEGPAGLDVEYVPFADGAFEQALAAAARLVGEAACVVHAANGLLTQPLAPLVELPREDAPDLVVLVHRRSFAGGSIGLAASPRRIARSIWRTCACSVPGRCATRSGRASRWDENSTWWRPRSGWWREEGG